MAGLKTDVADGNRRASRLRGRGQLQVHRQGGHRAGQAGRPVRRRARAERSTCSLRCRSATIPGVGPVTTEKLHRIGVRTIADLHRVERHELVQTLGRTHADALLELAYARDDRPVEPEREAKSISVEDTFEVDLVDQTALLKIIDRDARQVSSRLSAARLFARTITLKIKLHDFSTHTRSRTVAAPTDRPELITEVARSLLGTVDTTGGVRLLGVGVAGLTDVLQDRLFDDRPRRPIRPRRDVLGRRRAEVPTLTPGRRWPRRPTAPTGAGFRAPTSCTTSYGPVGSGAPAAAGSPYASRPGTPRPGRYAPSLNPTPRCGHSERCLRTQLLGLDVRARVATRAGTSNPSSWWGRAGRGRSGSQVPQRATPAARTSPRKRPWSSPYSGCHCTASQKRSFGVLDRLDCAVGGAGRRPIARMRGHGLMVVAVDLQPVTHHLRTREPGWVATETQPKASPPGECSSCPTTSGTCCSSSPPAAYGHELHAAADAQGRGAGRLGGVEQRELPGVPLRARGLGPRMRFGSVPLGFDVRSAGDDQAVQSADDGRRTVDVRRQQHGHRARGLDRAGVRGGQQIRRRCPTLPTALLRDRWTVRSGVGQA